jgi:hypothetical protein
VFLCESENKQRLFYCTASTDCSSHQSNYHIQIAQPILLSCNSATRFNFPKKPQESERQAVALQFELCAVMMPNVQVDKMAGVTAALCDCRMLIFSTKLG